MNLSFKPFPQIETDFTSIVYEDGTAQRYQRGEKYSCLNKGFLAASTTMR